MILVRDVPLNMIVTDAKVLDAQEEVKIGMLASAMAYSNLCLPFDCLNFLGCVFNTLSAMSKDSNTPVTICYWITHTNSTTRGVLVLLAAVALPLEIEIQVQSITIRDTLEALLV